MVLAKSASTRMYITPGYEDTDKRKKTEAIMGIKIRLEDPSVSRVCNYVRLNLLGPAGYAWERVLLRSYDMVLGAHHKSICRVNSGSRIYLDSRWSRGVKSKIEGAVVEVKMVDDESLA